jgi:hypothetical protein
MSVGTWLELSRDEDVFVLLALVQRHLGRHGYRISIEIARAADREKETSS